MYEIAYKLGILITWNNLEKPEAQKYTTTDRLTIRLDVTVFWFSKGLLMSVALL